MATSENVKGRGGLTGRHVLMMLIAFFGVIFAVNGVFLYAAISTFDGTDTSSAYQKGIDYNTTIAESEEQARRGWKGVVSPVAGAGGSRRAHRFRSDRCRRQAAGRPRAEALPRPPRNCPRGPHGRPRRGRRRPLRDISPKAGAGGWVIAVTVREPESSGGKVVYRMKSVMDTSAEIGGARNPAGTSARAGAYAAAGGCCSAAGESAGLLLPPAPPASASRSVENMHCGGCMRKKSSARSPRHPASSRPAPISRRAASPSASSR
ncbi:MAG: FixH family protein [Hyphomicrobiaceae bacterium]